MEGLTFEKNEYCSLFRVNSFSEELKSAIRENLTKICHGPETIKTNRFSITYNETLREFIKRYKDKSDKQKKGYIAELLTHILLFQSYQGFKIASAFFNLEDRGAKKGFDLVIFDPELEGIWITEVKSGSAAEDVRSNKVNTENINEAKNDLKKRLSSQNTTLWHNALNAADKALAHGDVKEQITKILDDCLKEASSEVQNLSSKNVILVSVTYKKTNDPISLSEIKSKQEAIDEDKIFQKVIVFSIQKETYEKVAKFLEDEIQ